MSERPVYRFHTDPAHGWLEVPLGEVERLAVEVSACSYVSPDRATVYLEEDCDASAFFKAACRGLPLDVVPFEVEMIEHRSDAPCRSFRHYTR